MFRMSQRPALHIHQATKGSQSYFGCAVGNGDSTRPHTPKLPSLLAAVNILLLATHTQKLALQETPACWGGHSHRPPRVLGCSDRWKQGSGGAWVHITPTVHSLQTMYCPPGLLNTSIGPKRPSKHLLSGVLHTQNNQETTWSWHNLRSSAAAALRYLKL